MSIPFPSFEKSAVSGLPVPPGLLAKISKNGKADQGGSPLKVLDWAGFEAAASYSFDDGQPSHTQHWAALKATGIPMTWYLWTGNNLAPYYDQTWKEALSCGHELGNHTKSHKRLAEMQGPLSMAKEIEDCEIYLTGLLGQSLTPSFAYPFGETGWKESFYINTDGSTRENSRFLLARSVIGGRIGPEQDIDPLMLPIFGVRADHSEGDFIDELDAALQERAWTIFMYHSILPGEDWYAGVSLESILGSLAHARKGEKMWLDTVLNIGAYWYAARQFRALEPKKTEAGLVWAWQLPPTYPPGRYLRLAAGQGSLWQEGCQLPKHPAGFWEVALDAHQLEWRAPSFISE